MSRVCCGEAKRTNRWLEFVLKLISQISDLASLDQGTSESGSWLDCCLAAKSCPTLFDPRDCSPQGSSVYRISWQKYWSGLPFLSPGNLSTQGWNSCFLQANSLPLSHLGSPCGWGPCCKLTSYLSLLMQVQKLKGSFTNCHCQKALPLAFKVVLSGSVSLDSVDSSWMLSNSPVSHAVQSPCISLLQQNQGLGRPGLAIL